METQLTTAAYGHVLTNINCFSPDGQWIAYDVRSDPAGGEFDGTRIEAANVVTREVRVLYESHNGACCGVVTCCPTQDKVIFILGPEHPTADWRYSANRRQGMIVDMHAPGSAVHLDARDLTPPFTPGALRGGTHVHVWEPSGGWVSFTYEDQVLEKFAQPGNGHDINQRNVGVSVPGAAVHVAHDHPRNHDGEYFTVLVTRTTSQPRPGSDDIVKACEEGWVGHEGYIRTDGRRQRHALAFQGTVIAADGHAFPEVFIVDIPEDVKTPGAGPLEGTAARLPSPPQNCTQRRLTFTADRKYPGLQGPRHWLRSTPDGSQIAFLMKDDAGIVQLWTVSPNGGQPRQITHNPWSVTSAFSFSPDGKTIAYVADNSVMMTHVKTGSTTRLTPRSRDSESPRPEACIFSPDGRRIAYVRHLPDPSGSHNQIFTVAIADHLR